MNDQIRIKSINSLYPKQKITAKQYEFARLVAEEHLTSSDAYRKAYRPTIFVKNKSIHEMACRVMTNIKVQSMIKSIQHKREEENRTRAIRREEYVLKKLTEEVEHGDKATSRIRALELLGKTVAMFSDKVELDTKKNERTSKDIKEELKLKLQKLLFDQC
jgi:regulator of PEP synthase PpsR (kinase-PPPase family)